MANKRAAKEQASSDLRRLRLLRTALASVFDARAVTHYKTVERQLIQVLDPSGGSESDGVSNLVKRLVAAGAKHGGK